MNKLSDGKPSPLAGEGGDRESRSQGEGENKHTASLYRARSLRRAMTDAELRLWRILRDRRLSGAKFRRQVPIGPYITDFACFEARLIIEADGGQHAESPSDAVRDAWFEKQNFRVLRFWNNDILNNPEGVMTLIATALSLAPTTPPHPAAARPPSPARGEGGSEADCGATK
jgi:very-short-patch-repair endonuclease